MTNNCSGIQPEPVYSRFKRIPLSEDWFEAYEIATDLLCPNLARNRLR
jgi:hypothetical protein